MLAPRWRKVVRDLWGSKARTVLVVLSIASGIFAVGMILTSRTVLAREMTAAYLASNPPSATLLTDAIDDELVDAVRGMPEVAAAERRGLVSVRLQTPQGQWRVLQLAAFGDYGDIRLGKVWPQEGAWPPPAHELVIERASLAYLGVHVGDTALVEMANGRQRQVRIAGLSYEPGLGSPLFTGQAYGHVTWDTLEWLGGPQSSQLGIVVAQSPLDSEHIRRVANLVRDRIEENGHSVFYLTMPPRPRESPFYNLIQPMFLILGVLGILSLLLSGLLVVNTISALLAQQVRQIGVMKAIGARGRQIVGLYLGMVLAYSLLALGLALPLGALGARAFTSFVAGSFNADIAHFNVPRQALALQIVVGLVVPVLAALAPILGGVRITVREAIGSYGLGHGQRGVGPIDNLLARIHGLGRPLLLSLRNTFRRKGRLALTLATLILGGAMFIAVFSVRGSLLRTAEDTLAFANFDVTVSLGRPYRVQQIEQEALRVPGVVRVECQSSAGVRRLRPNGDESGSMFVQAVPAAAMLRPTLLEGRWLVPEDEDAVVITTDMFRDEPDVGLGDRITLKIEGRETSWQVVGVIKAVLTNVPPIPFVYVNLPYFARVAGQAGRANQFVVETAQHDPAFQAQVARGLEERLKGASLDVGARQTAGETRSRITAIFDMLVAVLLIMAILLAIVGGLGLTGTMGLNVLERTREIGIMRAIGASNSAVERIVIAEGVTIGLLSWLAGAIIALPMGKLLADAVGVALLRMPLVYTFSAGGVLFWLVAVVVLSALASLLPARRASRLTVREVLAYE